MRRIRRDDTVIVITGKDRGKTGRVIKMFSPVQGSRGENCALVQGLNFVKRHTRPRRQDDRGGIIEKESPIVLSNLMPFCPNCKKGVRPKVKKEDGKEKRFCRYCEEEF